MGGPDPSKRPGRVPRPPTLVAPLRGTTRGAREGTRSLAQGQFRFSALIKGFLRVPHPLSPFECAPFGGENYRQFFHSPSAREFRPANSEFARGGIRAGRNSRGAKFARRRAVKELASEISVRGGIRAGRNSRGAKFARRRVVKELASEISVHVLGLFNGVVMHFL